MDKAETVQVTDFDPAIPLSYELARPLIRTGDLIAVRDVRSWLNRLTRWVTRKPITYTGVAKWEGNRLFIADLNSGYNHLTAVSHLTDFDVHQPPVGIGRDVIELAIDAWLAKRVKYGYASFIAIGIECVIGKRSLFDNWRSVVVCSGGSVQIYEMAAHIQLGAGRSAPAEWMHHSRQLSPGELADELRLKMCVRGAAA